MRNTKPPVPDSPLSTLTGTKYVSLPGGDLQATVKDWLAASTATIRTCTYASATASRRTSSVQ